MSDEEMLDEEDMFDVPDEQLEDELEDEAEDEAEDGDQADEEADEEVDEEVDEDDDEDEAEDENEAEDEDQAEAVDDEVEGDPDGQARNALETAPRKMMSLVNDGLANRKKKKKKTKPKLNEFIDYEAELSEGEEVSEDEAELSGDDEDDLELVADDGDEANSEDDERVRNLYQKQLDNEDRRQLLLLKEQLEEKEVALGAKRHKKFRWQTVDAMDRLMKHDDMDDFEEAEDGDGDAPLEDDDNEVFRPRFRPPPSDLLLRSSVNLGVNEASNSNSCFPSTHEQLLNSGQSNSGKSSDINRFLFRDKDTVTALSATNNEYRLMSVKATREDKERIVEREIKRVLQSKSIFDKLFD